MRQILYLLLGLCVPALLCACGKAAGEGTITDRNIPVGDVTDFVRRACPEAWVEVPRGVVAGEPDSDSQALRCEVQGRGRDSEIAARRTGNRAS